MDLAALRRLAETAMAWRRARQEVRKRQQELDLAVEALLSHDPKLSKEKAQETAQAKSPGLAAARKRYLDLTDKLEVAAFEFEKAFAQAKAGGGRKKMQVPWRAIAGAVAGFAGAIGQEVQQGQAPMPPGVRGRVIDVPGESV